MDFHQRVPHCSKLDRTVMLMYMLKKITVHSTEDPEEEDKCVFI